MRKSFATVATLAVSALLLGSAASAQSGALMPPPGPYQSSAPVMPVAPVASAPVTETQAPAPEPFAQPAWMQSAQQLPYWMQVAPPGNTAPQAQGQGNAQGNNAASMQGSGQMQGGVGFGGAASGQTQGQGWNTARPAYGAGVSPGYFPGYVPAPQQPSPAEAPQTRRVAPPPNYYRPQPYPAPAWGNWGVPFGSGFWPMNGPQGGYGRQVAPAYGTPYGYTPYQPYSR